MTVTNCDHYSLYKQILCIVNRLEILFSEQLKNLTFSPEELAINTQAPFFMLKLEDKGR